MSGALMIGMILYSFEYLAQKQNAFTALFKIFFGVFALGYLLQILGEFVGRISAMTPILEVLVFLFIIAFHQTADRTTRRSVRPYFWYLVIFCSVIWALFVSLQDTTLINFLGYGYDNYAHLAQARLLIDNEGTKFLASNDSSWPAFLQNSPQASGSVVASVSSIISANSASMISLRVLSSISLSLPLVAILGPSLGISKQHRNPYIVLVVISLVSIFSLTGYLSRIWFSGYFASNIATVMLILIAVAIASDEFNDWSYLVWAIVITLHFYPLIGLVSALIAVPKLFSILIIGGGGFKSIASKANSAPTYFNLVSATLLILPFLATRRSFGGSQFLTPGGIEPFPLVFLGVWVGFLVFLPTIILNAIRQSWSGLTAVILIALASVSISIYSYKKVSILAYYPTKLLISMMFVLVIFLIFSVLNYSREPFHKLGVTLVALAVLACAFFTPSSKVFVSSYMGELPATLVSAWKYEPAVVLPSAIVNLAKLSQEEHIAVLYIPTNREAELNTRWVNTLSRHWNDASWSNWMSIQREITSENFDEAASLLRSSPLLVATDDQKLLTEFLNRQLTNLCLLNSESVCVWRG